MHPLLHFQPVPVTSLEGTDSAFSVCARHITRVSVGAGEALHVAERAQDLPGSRALDLSGQPGPSAGLKGGVMRFFGFRGLMAPFPKVILARDPKQYVKRSRV